MLSIKVDSSAGSSINDQVLPEMIAFANKLTVAVEQKINGILVVIYPGADLKHVQDEYAKPNVKVVVG